MYSTGTDEITDSDCFVLGDLEVTVTLTWGANPSDLDTHLDGPASADDAESRFHLYYGDRELTVGEESIYLDVDANFVWPPSWGIAAEQRDLFLYVSNNTITNYFMATAPGTPIYAEIEQAIRANITGNLSQNVYKLTGPDAIIPILEGKDYTKESYRIVCHQGQFTNERLQYPDKTRKKWWREQEERSILR